MIHLSLYARIALTAAIAMAVLFVFLLSFRNRIKAELAILWCFVLIPAAAATAIPSVLAFLARITGTRHPASTLSFLGLGLSLFALIYLSAKFTVLFDQFKNLNQETTFMEKRVRDLEKRVDEIDPRAR